jgi:hypothetical protein
LLPPAAGDAKREQGAAEKHQRRRFRYRRDRYNRDIVESELGWYVNFGSSQNE